MSSRRPLLILGAGTMATNYAETFAVHPEFEICGFVEDAEDLSSPPTLEGHPVYSTESALRMADTHSVVGAIGSPDRRSLIERFEAAGFQFATLRSPQSLIHPRATIEPGCIISDQTDIDPYIRIGRHCIVSAKVSFGHHSSMGPFGFIGPGTIIAGNCTIGTGCYIGMAAVIKDHITVGDGATIGAGAVVVKDVEPGVTVVGNPARPLKSKKPTSTEVSSTNKPLLLLGAGDMAEVFAPAFNNFSDYRVVGYVVDDDASEAGNSLKDLPRLSIEEALELADTHTAVSIIGSPDKEPLVSRFESAGFRFAQFLSPLSDFSPDAVIEPGVIVSSYSLIDPFTRIGRHSIVSVKVLLSHHSEIGPFSFVGPGTTIAGNTIIGSRCYIGAGAVLRDGINIGDGAVIGAGAVVIKDVPPGVTVVGNPARPLSPKPEEKPLGSKTRKPLLILGAGDMASTYASEFRDDPDFEIVGFVVEESGAAQERFLDGLPVMGVEEALPLGGTHAALCAIGSSKRQPFIQKFEETGFEFATLISPSAIVHGRDGIEPGCVISDLANIDPHISLGRHTLVTSRVTVAHHASVGPCSFLAPGVTIGGHCKIGTRCFIGMGAIVRDHINIGDDVTVGAGAVVVSDVPDGQTVVGIPAKPLFRKDDGKAPAKKGRQPLLLLGAGEQSASHAENLQDHPEFEVVGFVQDVSPDFDLKQVEGRPVYYIDEVRDWAATHKVVCCIGSMKKRAIIEKFEALGFEFVTAISPTAMISPKAELGVGCFVSRTGQVASFARVGKHTMIGRMTMVGHHSTIGPYSLVAGSSVIGGGATIGAGCFIGMGSLIRDHIRIGDGATVGVGAVVIRDVAPGETVVGNPARPLSQSAGAPTPLKGARRPILILGAGGMARAIATNFRDNPDYEIAGFVQNADPRTLEKNAVGLPIHWLDDVLDLREKYAVISVIGSREKRLIIQAFDSAGFEFINLIAPTALVDRTANLGVGCVVTHWASIETETSAGNHGFFGRQTILAHHTRIGPYSMVAPGSLIAGESTIGSGCFVGMGSVLKDHLTIGDDVTIGAGSVVVKDVPSGAVVAGNPARILRARD